MHLQRRKVNSTISVHFAAVQFIIAAFSSKVLKAKTNLCFDAVKYDAKHNIHRFNLSKHKLIVEVIYDYIILYMIDR